MINRTAGWVVAGMLAFVLATPSAGAQECAAARGQMEVGLLDEARKAYGAVEAKDGELPDCVGEGLDQLVVRYRELGDAQLAIGETESAKSELLKALALRPDDAATQASLAGVLQKLDQQAFVVAAALDRAGDHAGAWAKAQEALKADVELPPALEGLFERQRDKSFDKARALAELGNLTEARKAAEKALEAVGGPLPTELEYIYGTPWTDSHELIRWSVRALPLLMPLLAFLLVAWLVTVVVRYWTSFRRKVLVDAFAVAEPLIEDKNKKDAVVGGEDFARRAQHSLAALGGLEQAGGIVRSGPVEIPISEVVGTAVPAAQGVAKIFDSLIKLIAPAPFRLTGIVQRPGPRGPGVVVQLSQGNEILGSEELWLKDFLGEAEVKNFMALDPLEGYAVLAEVVAVWLLSQWSLRGGSGEFSLLGSSSWRAVALLRAGTRSMDLASSGVAPVQRLKTAQGQFEEALEEDGGMFAAYHHLGRALWAQGGSDHEGQRRLFERVRKLLDGSYLDASAEEDLVALAAKLFGKGNDSEDLSSDRIEQIVGQGSQAFDSQRLIFYCNASYGELAKLAEEAIKSPENTLARERELAREIPRELRHARQRLAELSSSDRLVGMKQWDEAAARKVSATARSLAPVLLQLGWLEVEAGRTTADAWRECVQGSVAMAEQSFDSLFIMNVASFLDAVGRRLAGEHGFTPTAVAIDWQTLDPSSANGPHGTPPAAEKSAVPAADPAPTVDATAPASDASPMALGLLLCGLAGRLLKRSLQFNPNRKNEVTEVGAFAPATLRAIAPGDGDDDKAEESKQPSSSLSKLDLISDEMSSALAKHKVSTVADLLVATADPSRRQRLAKALDLKDSAILERWAHAAELLSLPGIDAEHCNLLLQAGIDSLAALQGASPPQPLAERFDSLMAVAKAIGSEVEVDLDKFRVWVEAAAGLSSIVR